MIHDILFYGGSTAIGLMFICIVIRLEHFL